DPENSETWRVTFRVTNSASAHPSTDARLRGLLREAPSGNCAKQHNSLPEPREARVEGKATSSVARFVSTWPPAEPFEPLLRAFNNPAPHIKRLARVLKRKSQIVRAYFLRTPPRTYGKSVLEEPIRDVTLLARQRYKDSS